jgi:hypothetical protein
VSTEEPPKRIRLPDPDAADKPKGVTFGDLRPLEERAAAGDEEAARELEEHLATLKAAMLPARAQIERIANSFATLRKLHVPKITGAADAWQKVEGPLWREVHRDLADGPDEPAVSLGPRPPKVIRGPNPDLVEVEPPESRMLDVLEAMLDVTRAQAEDARKAHRWVQISTIAAVIAIPVAILALVLAG